MRHSSVTIGGVHTPINFEYADQTERESDTGLFSEDIRKFARQIDDNSVWMLVSNIGPVWKRIDSAGGGGSTGYVAETLVYTDTTNMIIGPLSDIPSDVDNSNLFIINGVIQDYSVDYTVRQVAGGTVPGYYVCISPTSTAPGGGTFVGSSNPGTGIYLWLESGDRVRVTYPT